MTKTMSNHRSSTRWSTLFRVFTALTLKAQRLNIVLPNIIRDPLRSLLTRLIKDEIAERGVEDWSTPLIAGRDETVDQVAGATACRISGREEVPTATTDMLVPVPPLQAVTSGQQQPAIGSEAVASLRCLLVTSSLDVGGMDEVVVFLARRLPTGRLGRLLLEHGIEAVELGSDAGARWLEAWRPDVISAHDPPSWVLDTATRLSIPYVDTLHGMHSLYASDRATEAKRGRRLAGIVAVSDLMRRQYLDVNPTFSPERIVTIPNGVDDLRRTPVNRDWARARWGIRDEYVFVSLGRHCLQKNTYGLVAAFEDVAERHPEAHLVIAGRPDDAVYFTQVMRLRDALACRDHIHLRDYTPNPAELLALADGFVLDSFFEAWSLASMEALHTGVPVILSEVAGAREQVGDGDTRGYVIPNPLGDPLRVNWETIREARYSRQVNREALVAAMSSLINNRASWLAGRQRLMSDSVKRFHPDMCLRSHARVLAAAANGEPLPAREHFAERATVAVAQHFPGSY
jgi:glycosyltransferase involved in cell wall biosynthesis